MSTQRASDVIEEYATRGLVSGLGGLVVGAIGGAFIYFRGLWTPLGYVLVVIAVGAIGYSIYNFVRSRQVQHVTVVCPYCSGKNVLTEAPQDDFTCVHCHRLIPIIDGHVARVYQVRCGYCNHLNYYSDKSTGLICEDCDREIPIANEGPKTRTFHHFTQHDDPTTYELVLLDEGPKREEVIQVLQHMLALNRNQVKDILKETPVTLLTGITKLKGDMLVAQLASHGARAEARPVASTRHA